MSTAPRQRRAGERVQGLLIMLPWLAARKRVSIHEMASTFQLSVETMNLFQNDGEKSRVQLRGLLGAP